MFSIRSLIYILIVIGTAIACNDITPEKEQLPDDVLTLKVSAQKVSLSLAEMEETAITLSWSTGTNYGTGKAILYSLNFAVSDKKYDINDEVELGKHLYSISYTAEELNDIILSLTSLATGGTEVSCKARITARIPDEDRTQTSEVSFTVETYRPAPAAMYLTGSATGSDVQTAMLDAGNGIFVWQGTLAAGNVTVLNTEYGINLNQTVTSAGKYTVMADMKDDTITISSADDVWFVCEEDGWAFTPMQQVSPGVFTIIRDLKSGQFKFGTIPQVWHYMYVSAETDNAPWDSTSAIFREESTSATDWKWFIWNSEPVPYEITLETTSEGAVMKMKPYHTQISMTGDATPGGWSLDDRTQLTRTNVMTFIWEGELKEGELKFCCGNTPEYGKGEWMMPMQDQAEFSPAEDIPLDLIDASIENAPDKKWKISKDGRYSITLNQYTQTLTIKEIQ